MTRNIITLLLLVFFTSLFAQKTVIIPKYLNNTMDSITKQHFNQSLETLFSEITKGTINEHLLTKKWKKLTKSQLQELVNYELKKDSSSLKIKDKQLINVYPISDNEYFISVSYTYQKKDTNPILVYIINLIATKNTHKFTFSIPVDYVTRYWKTKVIGNITYHYRDALNIQRAQVFDNKNSEIAKKFLLEPEKLDFYMTDNFQEISNMLGFGYSLFSNGKYRDGYGVDANIVFAIMNNEDFSHDIFHYYSGKVNSSKTRNWVTEEGLAYLWGNAYYTDKNGKMITQQRLTIELQKYLLKNSNTNLYQLFSNNQKIFNNIAPEISVRSVISGIIAKEIEIKKGKKGITKLINAGRKNRLESYLKVTDELIGINKENFNTQVRELLYNN